MRTTTKEIKRTLTVIKNKQYNEVRVYDEHWDEVQLIGYDWGQAGYTWDKDIQPIIEKVEKDGKERTINMIRFKDVVCFDIDKHEAFAKKIENGYGDADINK